MSDKPKQFSPSMLKMTFESQPLTTANTTVLLRQLEESASNEPIAAYDIPNQLDELQLSPLLTSPQKKYKNKLLFTHQHQSLPVTNKDNNPQSFFKYRSSTMKSFSKEYSGSTNSANYGSWNSSGIKTVLLKKKWYNTWTELDEVFDDDRVLVPSNPCNISMESITDTIVKSLVDSFTVAIKKESSTPETSSLPLDPNGPFSQASNSFTFYQPLVCNDFFNSKKSQDFKKILHTHTFTQSRLLKTINLYRKQQQLRLANNRMKTKEQYGKEKSSKNNYIDEKMVTLAERVAMLDTVIKEQNNIIRRATQTLRIVDAYREENYQYLRHNEYSDEHLDAEGLLLIANLKRTDAMLEIKKLHNEYNLSSEGIAGRYRSCPPGNGKRLVIYSLRIPLLTAMIRENYSIKNKADLRTKTLIKWPQEIRYFVCVIRAAGTVYRPPITIATRPIDTLNQSINRFILNNNIPYNEYVEFINKEIDSSGRICPDTEGTPIIIDGLENSERKITVELYGLYPTESPAISSAVRNTMYGKLAFFVFSSNKVDCQQFTLNYVYKFKGSTSIPNSAVPTCEPKVAHIGMQILEDGENYVHRHVQSDLNNSMLSKSQENLLIKPLKLPSECKITEGFITLLDESALRIPFNFESNKTSKWQHFLNKDDEMKSMALWTRLWFKVEVNDLTAVKDDNEDNNGTQINEKTYPQTVILKYWLYHKPGEENREIGGIIDLSGCLPLKLGVIQSKPYKMGLLPAAQPYFDLHVKPNAARLLFTAHGQNKNTNEYPLDFNLDDPLILAFDTPEERDEWCNTINEAVKAIAEYQEQFTKFHKLPNKQ